LAAKRKIFKALLKKDLRPKLRQGDLIGRNFAIWPNYYCFGQFLRRQYGLVCVFLEFRRGLMWTFFTFKLKFDEKILAFFSLETVWVNFYKIWVIFLPIFRSPWT
jgi:hypothetical protein